MPSPRRTLRESDVRRFVEEQCFRPGSGCVGAEIELFPTGDAGHEAIVAAAGKQLPGGSVVTFEPGGQIELSSPPGTIDTVVDVLTADQAALRARLAPMGASLDTWGVHPEREPVRVLHQPRY